jgi:hypothetical protein
MKRSALVAALLLAVLAVLTPLALASPPDPLWVGGFFDAADFDDVVVAVTSTDGATDGAAARVVTVSLPALGTVPPSNPIDPVGGALPVFQGRAPPAA